jgi:hypothetical protein
VTGITAGLGMGAFQQEVGFLMIECGSIEKDDIGRATYMLCVAVFTVGLLFLWNSAVKSTGRFYVIKDVFMCMARHA